MGQIQVCRFDADLLAGHGSSCINVWPLRRENREVQGGENIWELDAHKPFGNRRYPPPQLSSKGTADCRKCASRLLRLMGRSTCTERTSPPGDPRAGTRCSSSVRSRGGMRVTQFVAAYLSVSPGLEVRRTTRKHPPTVSCER